MNNSHIVEHYIEVSNVFEKKFVVFQDSREGVMYHAAAEPRENCDRDQIPIPALNL